MPLTKSAAKALRRSIKRNQTNRTTRDDLKEALDAAKKTPTEKTVSLGYRFIDRATKKHIMHPNKAARLKSQLAKKLVKTAPVPKVATKKTVTKKPATKKKV